MRSRPREVDVEVRRHRRAAGGEVEIVGQRVADHLGLLVDLLRHEVAVVALVDQQAGGERPHHRPLRPRRPTASWIVSAPRLRHHPVAVLEIGDAVGERGERDRIGAEEDLAVAVADGERAAAPRADHQVVLALEQDRQRERALEPGQRRRDRIFRRHARVEVPGDEMGDHLGIGLGVEAAAVGGQLLLELAVVLDDAVVDQRQPLGRVRVGIGLGRLAVGGPAGVADAGAPGQAATRSSFASRLRSLPSARHRVRCPSSSVATPAES